MLGSSLGLQGMKRGCKSIALTRHGALFVMEANEKRPVSVEHCTWSNFRATFFEYGFS